MVRFGGGTNAARERDCRREAAERERILGSAGRAGGGPYCQALTAASGPSVAFGAAEVSKTCALGQRLATNAATAPLSVVGMKWA